MRPQLIKRLEEVRPTLAEAKDLGDQLIKRLEAVSPAPGEAKDLGERMPHGRSSETARQRLLAILEAEEAALGFLAWWNPPGLRARASPSAARHAEGHAPWAPPSAREERR